MEILEHRPEITCRMAASPDALSLSVLATQVFLDTYATQTRLYVQRPFLGKGIGKELLARAETLAARERAEILWLTAWTRNAHALRFYEARGYQDVGGSVYTFEGDTYDTRVFVKTLPR